MCIQHVCAHEPLLWWLQISRYPGTILKHSVEEGHYPTINLAFFGGEGRKEDGAFIYFCPLEFEGLSLKPFHPSSRGLTPFLPGIKFRPFLELKSCPALELTLLCP